MVEPDLFLMKAFRLSQRHIDYLSTVNPSNESDAIRCCLDRLIDLDAKKDKMVIFSDFSIVILIVSLGLVFLVFSYSNVFYGDTLSGLFSLIIGMFLAFYGVLYGVMAYKVHRDG